MAGNERMAIEEVVRQVLLDEHADVLRESLKLLVRELMEAEVVRHEALSDRAGCGRRETAAFTPNRKPALNDVESPPTGAAVRSARRGEIRTSWERAHQMLGSLEFKLAAAKGGKSGERKATAGPAHWELADFWEGMGGGERPVQRAGTTSTSTSS